MDRDIWLSAAHIPGKVNEADHPSRHFNDDKEWMLSKDVFQSIMTSLAFSPQVDMFASRLNTQLPVYASWKPDPHATYIDAFSTCWFSLHIYAFPPFPLISRTLQKLEREEVEGVLIVPVWHTQTWHPKLLKLLVCLPLLLPTRKYVLFLPHKPAAVHPLLARAKPLCLAACRLSDNPFKCAEFQKTLPHSFYMPGEIACTNNTAHTFRNGSAFAIAGRLITYSQL